MGDYYPAISLQERLVRLSVPDRRLHVIDSDHVRELPWHEVHRRAQVVSGRLAASGVRPGDRVALLGRTTLDLVVCVQAVWLRGAAVVMVPFYQRSRTRFGVPRSSISQVTALEPALILMDDTFDQLAATAAPVLPLRTFAHVAPHEEGAVENQACDPDQIRVIQLTSGTTGIPKAVGIPEYCLLHNVDALMERLQIDPNVDRVVSWLPLYHDMGLIGQLTIPMTTSMQLVLADTSRFTARPDSWIQWLSDYHATVTCAPSFAYSLLGRLLPHLPEFDADLRCLRLVLNGAESIDVAGFLRFLRAGATLGLRADAACGVYGLAEATLAVSVPSPGEGLRVDTIRTDGLHVGVAERAHQGRVLAKLGRPLRDMQVQIVGMDGQPVGERQVGDLQVKGPSAKTVYLTGSAAAPTARSNGWIATGDRAYWADGELVVCARSKDVIIVGGRNFYPEALEEAAAGVPGVRPGAVAAIGVPGTDGTERVVLLVEAGKSGEIVSATTISESVREACGVSPTVVTVPAGSLSRTTSGKLSRSACRQMYLSQSSG